MSAQSSTLYVCDRCERQTRLDYGRPAPSDWHRLMLTRPLLASPLEAVHSQRFDKHLCAECAYSLLKWLSGESLKSERAAS